MSVEIRQMDTQRSREPANLLYLDGRDHMESPKILWIVGTGLDHVKHGFGDKGWSQANVPQHETLQVTTWPRFHPQRPAFENDRHDNDPVDIIWGLRIPTALSYEHWIVTISHHIICQLPRAEGQSTCEACVGKHASEWVTSYKWCQWLSVQIMVEHFQPAVPQNFECFTQQRHHERTPLTD